MKARVNVGNYVAVTFLDHFQHKGDVGGEMMFEVVGRLTREDKYHMVISTWHYAKGFMERDDNCEEFSIVKRAIVQVKRLR